jgi:hypothetical protein
VSWLEQLLDGPPPAPGITGLPGGAWSSSDDAEGTSGGAGSSSDDAEGATGGAWSSSDDAEGASGGPGSRRPGSGEPASGRRGSGGVFPPPASRRELPGLRGWRGSEPVVVGADPPEEPGPAATAALLATAASRADDAGVLAGYWDRIVEYADWLAERGTGAHLGATVLLGVRDALARVSALAWRRHPLDLDAAGWHEACVGVERSLLEAAVAGSGALRGRRGWDPDAGLVAVAWLGPWPPDDAVVGATIERVRSRLGHGPWVLPYPEDADDGWPGTPPASVEATLWMARAEALSGQVDEANLRMEAVATLAGPLGLLPESVDPTTGEARGNRPSAGAHLAWIEAALAVG